MTTARATRPAALSLVALAVALLVGAGGCMNHVVYREKGVEALNRNDPAGAQVYLRSAVEKKPTDWRSQYLLGLSLLKSGRAAEAQIPLEQALQLKPQGEEAPEVIDALAESLFQQKRYEPLANFLAEVAGYYNTPRDFMRQGRYLEKTGDPDGAIVAYGKAGLFAPPTDPEPYIAMADLYDALGDVPKAVQALKWAYHADPYNANLPDRFRRHGLVPGPTMAEAPPKAEQPKRGLVPFKLPTLDAPWG